MVAVVVGAIFLGQELNQDGVMNINGAIFLFLTNMTFQNVFSVANVSCDRYNQTKNKHTAKNVLILKHFEIRVSGILC